MSEISNFENHFGLKTLKEKKITNLPGNFRPSGKSKVPANRKNCIQRPNLSREQPLKVLKYEN